MKRIIIIGFLFLIGSYVFGQNKSDTIVIKRIIWTVYKQDGRRLSLNQVINITKFNPDAYNEMKIARGNLTKSYLFVLVGAFIIGHNLGAGIGKGRFNWTQAGIGLGFIGISIPYSIAYRRHAKNSVRFYNIGLK